MTTRKHARSGKPSEAQPVGIRAGAGRHVFDLATLGKVVAGPGYSTAAGALVEGERMMIGLMRMPRGTGALPHSHPNEQWAYVLEGTLKVDIDGRKWDAKAGSLVFIPANAVHALVASTDGDAVFLTAKDTSHGIAGTAVGDASAGAHYEPGFAPKKR
ncbi:MAG TPA: cupin domain-containing protein [Burkholderiales bacterium]|nr:cupin domain-containing protein [Burkholderiales bacterium]